MRTRSPVDSWVMTVLLTRYSAAWQPEAGLVRGRCDAPIAPAFRDAFPHGCQRSSGHAGDHTPFEGVGRRMKTEPAAAAPWPPAPDDLPLNVWSYQP